jgi:H+/Cl- antiporter ClcA
MKRYRERPSGWHVIVTCFALFYLLVYFVPIWTAFLNQPVLREDSFFWPIWIVIGLGLAWIGQFLIRELIRQVRLTREWKSK